MADTERIRIAIDGPAAAGKSTVAKRLAKKLSFTYIDTGAMYRALTLRCLEEDIALTDEEAVYRLLLETSIELKQMDDTQKVLLNGKDVTDTIRSQEVSRQVSLIARFPKVRAEMLRRQQAMAKEGNIIMDGRDIGTNVLPDAEVKFYLIASVDERAKRRFEENERKGIPSDFAQLKSEIAERDRRDMERKHGPLRKAEDAIAIDTTKLTIEEVLAEMLAHVNKVRKFRED